MPIGWRSWLTRRRARLPLSRAEEHALRRSVLDRLFGLGELQPLFEKIDLDDHRNNPEIIQDRVKKVEVKKMVEWL